MSRQVAIPLNMETVTLNVIVTKDTAANSVLSMWPTEKIETTVSEYFNKNVTIKGAEDLTINNNSLLVDVLALNLVSLL